MLYLGRFNNTIDTKGLVVIPAKFREKLGESFVICGGFEHSLWGYSMPDFEEYERKLEEAAAKTKLPDQPDMEKVEKFVERVNRYVVTGAL